MGFQIFLVVIGTSLLFRPALFSGPSMKAHAKRLAELDRGEPEAFFEERRSLQTYPPARRHLIWRRVLGGVMVLSAVGLFLVSSAFDRNASAQDRAAALAASREALAEARLSIAKAGTGDPAAYMEAKAALARAETAVQKSERLTGKP